MGAGSFGTAVAVLLVRTGLRTALLCRTAEQADELARGRHNQRYLPGVELPREPSTWWCGSRHGCDAARLEAAMKTEIHPEYVPAHVRCTCGNEFWTRSTKPELHVEICSNCHPFYTGRQKLVDTGGRVERFRRRAARAGH